MGTKINDPLVDLTIERKFGGSSIFAMPEHASLLNRLISKARLPWNRVATLYRRYFKGDPLSTEMGTPVRRFSDGSYMVMGTAHFAFTKEILNDILYECFPYKMPLYNPCPHCGKYRLNENPYIMCEHCVIDMESSKTKQKLFSKYEYKLRSPFK